MCIYIYICTYVHIYIYNMYIIYYIYVMCIPYPLCPPLLLAKYLDLLRFGLPQCPTLGLLSVAWVRTCSWIIDPG